MSGYAAFLERKRQMGSDHGFEPTFMPDCMFDFQRHLTEWAVRKGRAGVFADCVAGETVVDTEWGPMPIAELFMAPILPRVCSRQWDGSVTLARSSRPWINGVDKLYEVRMASGRVIRATKGHRLLTASGWKTIGSLRIGECLPVYDTCRPPSNSALGRSVHLSSDRRCNQTAEDWRGHYSACRYQYDVQLPTVLAGGRETAPLQADAPAHTRLLSCVGDRVDGSSRSHLCRCTSHLSMSHSWGQVDDMVEGVGCLPLSFDHKRIGGSSHSDQQAAATSSLGRQTFLLHSSAKQRNGGGQFAALESSSDTVVAIYYIRTDLFWDIEIPDFGNYLSGGLVSHNCGLGKTLQELVFGTNVLRRENKSVLLLTPLAVSEQIIAEGEKFGIDCERSRGGRLPKRKTIVVTNYERLHRFRSDDFAAIIADESSRCKHFDSRTKKDLAEFARRISYRLLATATAAPNDYHELGNSSEILGYLGYQDMLNRFFKEKESKDYLGWGRKGYRFKGHAEKAFWKWACSWARSCRKPSDLGFEDNGFILPPLQEIEHIVPYSRPHPNTFLAKTAKTRNEQLAERRVTLRRRCEKAAEIVGKHDGASVIWCHLNPEADYLERIIPGALQVSGSMSDELKEERLIGFSRGDIRILVTKPKIGAFGLNWQHCHNIVTFPSHSFEQYYQSVRRCWRFGQKNEVKVHVVTSEGERRVMANLKRKSEQADRMFDALVAHMKDELSLDKVEQFDQMIKLPSWIGGDKRC